MDSSSILHPSQVVESYRMFLPLAGRNGAACPLRACDLALLYRAKRMSTASYSCGLWPRIAGSSTAISKLPRPLFMGCFPPSALPSLCSWAACGGARRGHACCLCPSSLGWSGKVSGRGEKETSFWGGFAVALRSTMDWVLLCTRYFLSLFHFILQTIL